MSRQQIQHGFMVDAGRLAKARKIEAVVADFLKLRPGEPLASLKILDAGCGSGHIASYFAARNTVVGTDVVAQVNKDLYDKFAFVQVEGADLPFADESFDLVLSNHVLSYVDEQAKHVAELKRVLKRGGLCYFASPNRLFPLEPHYRIPFVHYLPTPLYNRIMLALKKYQHEVKLLSYGKMLQLFRAVQFEMHDYTPQILRGELAGSEYAGIRLLPDLAAYLSPTNVFLLRRP